MPSTPKLVTRANTTSTNITENLGKGSKLTFAEMDSNFIELKNGSIGIVGDDSTGIDLAHGSTLKVAGTGGISTTVSGDTLTVDASSIVTSTLGDLTAIGSTLISPSNADLTLQASGTGNITTADKLTLTGETNLSPNLEVSSIHGASSTKMYIGNDPNRSTQGNSIYAEGAPLHLEASGSNNVVLKATALTLAAGEGMIFETTGGGSGNGTIVDLNLDIINNKITTKRSNEDLILDTNASGEIILNASSIQVGPDAASGLNNTTITGGDNNSVALVGGSTGGTVKVMPGAGNGTGEVGDIYLTPGSSTAQIKVGDGSNQAIISSNSTQDLILRTNDGTTEPFIQLEDGANGNVTIRPHDGGTGITTIGNSSTVSTGDLGGGTVSMVDILFRDPSGLAGAGRTNFNAIEIPFTPDGSTSNDLYIGLDSNADPYITFNNASTTTGQGAKIKTNTGNLILQSGSERIELAANTVQIGNNTIVVSGNRMFTDASNEDLEFDANGTGNVSSLAQLNMNSNKIINVTDPTANQDAATKAYVDAQVLASGDTGDLTINGSTITAPSNADLTLTVAGTGQIVVDGTLTATEVISDLTGTIEFDAKATEAITKGEAVYIAGIDGNTPTVALARANAAGTMPGFGIAADDIALNATGKITTFGSLTGLDAADFGETAITFSLGDTVYISSAEAGKLTNVAPAGEANFIQNIGKIERATPTTNITIKVGGAGRSNATPALNDGNIFIGNASNQAVTTSLQTQVESYSINNVVEDTTPQLGGDLDINGNSIVSVSGGNISITPDTTGNIILDGLTFPNADGTADQILGTNGSGVLSFRDPTAINIDGGVADSVYTSVPTIDGGTA